MSLRFSTAELSSAARAPWAKTDKSDPSLWLSLAQHMADSGGVADALWEGWASAQLRARLAQIIGLNVEQAGVLYAWLASVHDVGKATLTFQTQLATRGDTERSAFLERLIDAELPIRIPPCERQLERFPHGLASGAILKIWLEDLGLAPRIAHSVAGVVDAHHGIASESGHRLLAADVIAAYPSRWSAVHKELLDHFAESTNVLPLLRSLTRPLLADAQQLLTGLVIMADWIASNQNQFPLSAVTDEARRLEQGLDLDISGPWHASPLGEQSVNERLRSRFNWPSEYAARPVQKAVAEACTQDTAPGLVIVEAPTGEGKTEAALLAAEILASRTGAGGVMVAAPTMSTADGLYRRILDWARQASSAEVISMVLSHSRAHLNADHRALRTSTRMMWDDAAEVTDDDLSAVFDDASVSGAERGAVIASQWLSGRKKGILANMVVGTVDQVLVMALQSRHSMLRHVGLASKVVIIDEVHAYDAYMSEYLYAALAWLARYRVPVVLLSATLPLAQKHALVEAYGAELTDAPLNQLATTYPLITSVSQDGVQELKAAAGGEDLQISLSLLDDDLASLLDLLGDLLGEGGCALVICNTVQRAQETYQALTDLFPEEVELHHAAFLATDRAAKEERLRHKLGPQARRGTGRPDRLIVVATQVAEQSLDIDADLLITDIAPMDLLVQRIGRLHRHRRPPTDRPARVQRPQVWVRAVEDPELGVIDAGARAVYDERTLLTTLALLRAELIPTGFARPSSVPSLIQRTYGKTPPSLPPAWGERWEAAVRASATQRQRAQARASTFRMPLPSQADRIEALFSIQAPSVDSEFGEARGLAQVRDSEPTVEVVPILVSELGYKPLPQVKTFDALIPFDAELSPSLSFALAAGTVRLPTRVTRGKAFDLVVDALERATPLGWRSDPWLRGQIALPLSEGSRTVELNGTTLSYHDSVGLVQVNTYSSIPTGSTDV